MLWFSPQSRISQVAHTQIQQYLLRLFMLRGMPQWIKVDNGLPFGRQNRKSIPPLALWLIGMGIQVHWNRIRRPQDNAKVERNQGTLNRWAEPKKCKTIEELQNKLSKAIICQTHYYRISREQDKTRLELFPELVRHTGKACNHSTFCLKRVLQFIAKGNWVRKVSKQGQIDLINKRYYLGKAYSKQLVWINLDPVKNQWIIKDSNGEQTHTLDSGLTEIWIQNLCKKEEK